MAVYVNFRNVTERINTFLGSNRSPQSHIVSNEVRNDKIVSGMYTYNFGTLIIANPQIFQFANLLMFPYSAN